MKVHATSSKMEVAEKRHSDVFAKVKLYVYGQRTTWCQSTELCILLINNCVQKKKVSPVQVTLVKREANFSRKYGGED